MALPALGPILLGVIVAAAFRILLALGIGFVSYTVALPAFYSFIAQYLAELPVDILNMIGILRLDIAMTMILSAAAARMAYKISAAPLVSIGG